jgi:membrane associated rhomboid family serine protease
MRKYVPNDVVNALWMAAKDHQAPHALICPSCQHKMAEVAAPGAGFGIDVCTLCSFVWFDSGEYPLLPKVPPKPVEKPLPPEIVQLLALRQLEEARRQARDNKGAPDGGWKYIPALLGVPVEFDAEQLSSVPYVTWSLMLLLIAVSFCGFLTMVPIETFGLIPAQAGRMGGVTFFTSFFLHGSWTHLLGNLYFLSVFGDNVEDVLGHWRFLTLLAASALVGALAHVLTVPESTGVCIGASAGISGILTYYVLRFPKHRFGLLFSSFWPGRHNSLCWVRFPAPVYFGFWIFMQMIGIACGPGDVAYTAHLGGLLTGALYFLAERWTERRQ